VRGFPPIRSIFKEIVIYGVLLIVIANVVSYLRSPEVETKPAFTGQLIDGSMATLDEFAGKPLILHFWATWCPTCKLEAPAIESLSHDYQVLTVAVESGDDAEIGAFMQEKGYTFPVLNDNDGSIRRLFKVKAFPTTFILDKNGEIVFTEVGYTSGIGLRIRMKLAE
jgi:thiol-disulfide isomerase/thioredoxin